jgi:hypothetical protein
MVWLIVLGYGCELAGIGLLVWDVLDRAARLQAFKSARTPVGVTIGLAWEVEEARTIAPAPIDVEERLDRLEQRFEDERDKQGRELQDATKRISEAIEMRVGDVESALSARLEKLRGFVVDTTKGVGRAGAALAFLVSGLLSQAAAALIALD